MKRQKRSSHGNHGDSAENPHRNVRSEIAYLAARLIAEEGITDFAAAKQKAARQLGIADQGSLPDNVEVDAALKSHQALFQRDSQPQECRGLRQIAIEVMRGLDRFSPWLVGAVLTGSANRFSTIEIEIVADDAKQLEMFFLNIGTPFDTRIKRASQTPRGSTANGSANDISIYEISFKEIPVLIAFYPNHSVRAAHHPCGSLRHARAQLADVEALLA